MLLFEEIGSKIHYKGMFIKANYSSRTVLSIESRELYWFRLEYDKEKMPFVDHNLHEFG